MIDPFVKYSEILKDANAHQWIVHRSLAWEAYRAAMLFDQQAVLVQIEIENQFNIWWSQYSGGTLK